MFEYALVRVVPRVERGEAINAGVIVYSKAYRYLQTKIELDEARLLALNPAADLAAIRAALSAFERASRRARSPSARWASAVGVADRSPLVGRAARSRCTAARPTIPPGNSTGCSPPWCGTCCLVAA